MKTTYTKLFHALKAASNSQLRGPITRTYRIATKPSLSEVTNGINFFNGKHRRCTLELVLLVEATGALTIAISPRQNG